MATITTPNPNLSTQFPGSQPSLPQVVLTEGNDISNYFGAGWSNTAQEIWALGGNDRFTIGTGDYAHGGAGNDEIRVFGSASIDGGIGEDTLVIAHDDATEQNFAGVTATIDLATGRSTATYLNQNGTVLNTTQSFTAIENAGGVYGNDTILGNGVSNKLWGDKGWTNGGNDYLDGRGGNDFLYGEAGNDILIGGAGADVNDGGAGFDIASYSTATAGLTLDLARPGQSTGDALGDTFASIEQFDLSAYGDQFVGAAAGETVHGRDGNDRLIGNAGADQLYGDAGNDVLYGGTEADTLNGGSGLDYLFGDAGNDYLIGGSERDYFSYNARGFGRDTIGDFTDTVDLIDMRSLASSGVHSFADLTITQGYVGRSLLPATTIGLGSDSITLNYVSASQITASDFLFA